jgi:hypothetical protein
VFENGTPGRWMNAGPSPVEVHERRTLSAVIAVAGSGPIGAA